MFVDIGCRLINVDDKAMIECFDDRIKFVYKDGREWELFFDKAEEVLAVMEDIKLQVRGAV